MNKAGFNPNVIGSSISHTGYVSQLSENKAYIIRSDDSVCHSCSARGACGVDELNQRIFEVDKDNLRLGDKVTIRISRTAAMRALLVAYIIPILIVVGSLLSLLYLGLSEAASGLYALLTLPVYYGLLRLFRGPMASAYQLTIHKT